MADVKCTDMSPGGDDGAQITEEAARRNREAWDSFRRQRDEGLVTGRSEIAVRIAKGESFLDDEYVRLVGDVRGKRLLDLGCGDGAELVSWARLGASVVGVDNSARQLAEARRAAEAAGLDEARCQLVQADLLRLQEALLRGEFDVVFSSGVSTWIGDLELWFGDVYRALRPGGVFVLGAAHSLAMFYRERQNGATDWASYFDEGPFTQTLGGESGAAHRWNPAGDSLTTVQWVHTLGHLLTAIAQAGLRIEHVVETPDAAETYGVAGGPGTLIVRATKG